MTKAQGSLEYMVIIAVVLAIAGITAIFMSGILSGQSSTVSVAGCKQASEVCRLSRMSSPADPCLSCDTACTNPTTGQEIFSGATYCCVEGKGTLIYAGSEECASLVDALCGNGVLDNRFGEECDTGADTACPGLCRQCNCVPSVQFTNPQNGQTVTGTVTLTATATDAGNDMDYVEFFFRVGRALKACDSFSYGPGPTYSATCDTTTISEGTFTVYAVAYDKKGGSNEASIQLTVSRTCPTGTIKCDGICTTPVCTSSADCGGTADPKCVQSMTCVDGGTCNAHCEITYEPEGTSCGTPASIRYCESPSSLCTTTTTYSCLSHICVPSTSTSCTSCSLNCCLGTLPNAYCGSCTTCGTATCSGSTPYCCNPVISLCCASSSSCCSISCCGSGQQCCTFPTPHCCPIGHCGAFGGCS